MFLDLEGDPFADDGGREYLFGYAFKSDASNLNYVGDWSFSATDERAAFERFVDFIEQRRKRFPDLHIYHYAPYEPGALKRLMGRYASREEEIDGMLRAQLFVDLYGIVKHAVRASVESYSIKRLEPLYQFVRSVDLARANIALFRIQRGLELGDAAAIDADARAAVAGYNRDDCLSTASLRDWLEHLRSETIEKGSIVPRPAPVVGAPTENVTAWQARLSALVSRLLTGIPADAAMQSRDASARHLLAYILDWHRREKKALWWEYFHLADLSDEELLDERAGVSGLSFVGEVGGTQKAPIHRYKFPPQDVELRGEDLWKMGGERLGTLANVDLDNATIDIKKRGDTASVHPTALFEHTVISTDAQAESLMRVGEYVAARGMSGPGLYKLARDLLMREPPDLGGEPLSKAGEDAVESATRIAPLLRGVLPIQGPPGAGKTYSGARMILALIRAGKTIGVTANSHKVIRTLLDEVIKAAGAAELDVHCLHKTQDKLDNLPHLTFTNDDGTMLSAIGKTAHVISGTSWFWAKPTVANAVDVLFVDEAAQMSLANVLSVCQAAKALVLLGDPQQLEQPMQGTHPEGTDVSALDYVLEGRQTIAPEQGLFLDQTWRLSPTICEFTSELFYEGRLRARPGLERQQLVTPGPLSGAGLRYIAVKHSGNQTSCPEEADRVSELVRSLIDHGTRWIDRKGVERPLGLSDILIIAPYNAQVAEIQGRIPGARVGTVDKFQGQEAAVVFYSVTTSSAGDAPRGMEFLYSSNRLNVATSRARCVCILVANPDVFQPECKTPRQIHLANGYCRYLELAS